MESAAEQILNALEKVYTVTNNEERAEAENVLIILSTLISC